MTRRIRAFGAFWYGFIVGDDWRVAVGVLLALALTDVVSRASVVPDLVDRRRRRRRAAGVQHPPGDPAPRR